MNQSVSQSVGQRVLAALPTVQHKTAVFDNTHTRTSKSFTTATLNLIERWLLNRNQKIIDLQGENLSHCFAALFMRLNDIPDSVRGPETKTRNVEVRIFILPGEN